MEFVDFEYKVYDNFLKIIPKDGVKDNSKYELRIKHIASTDGKELDNYRKTITTKLTPCYCTLEQVKTVVGDFNIPNDNLLYLIREASKHVDYIRSSCFIEPEIDDIKYEVEQFVKTKAILDSIIKGYISRTDIAGLKGKLGNITFENTENLGSIKNMIDFFKKELKKWEDAIRGYRFEGRNDIRTVQKSSRTTKTIPVERMLSDFSRNMDMGIRGNYHVKRR